MTGAHSNWSPLRENQWNDQIWSQQIGGGETIGEGDQKFRGSAKDALCPFPLITIAKETMKWSNRISKNRGEKNDFFSVVTISKLCLLKKEQNLLCWDARKLILSKNQIQTRGRSVLSKQPDCGWPIFSWRQDPEFDSSNKTKSKNEESGS